MKLEKKWREADELTSSLVLVKNDRKRRGDINKCNNMPINPPTIGICNLCKFKFRSAKYRYLNIGSGTLPLCIITQGQFHWTRTLKSSSLYFIPRLSNFSIGSPNFSTGTVVKFRTIRDLFRPNLQLITGTPNFSTGTHSKTANFAYFAFQNPFSCCSCAENTLTPLKHNQNHQNSI